jgi:aldose sugar dehydrogenase
MQRWILAASVSVLSIAPAAAQQSTIYGDLKVETIASGLRNPWGLAFLPDGRFLVTERPGQMRLISRDGKKSEPLAGVPRVYAVGQGGLLDVVLDRDFAESQTIYFCFAEPMEGGGRTSLARARLRTDKIEDVRVIFRQAGPPSTGNHWGCRITQTPDRNLFLTLGDHDAHRNLAQSLDNHIGKIVRVRPDGSVPTDNPFVNRKDALPEIWSYGHRNLQGAALEPSSGRYFTHEHGAKGGDEINVPEAGKNYGWPIITYGVDYSGAKIGIGTERAGLEQPVYYWKPSIAPSGMAFYQGDLFPAWRGNMFVGGLASQSLVRVEIANNKVAKEERLLEKMSERIRDVRSGPDGALWLLTDARDGKLLRVSPK